MFNPRTNNNSNNNSSLPAVLMLARKERKKSPIERVKSGEEFMVVGDRFENRYRFEKVDGGAWALRWNHLFVAAATAGNFFLKGFVVNMRVLGQVSRLQVFTEDIRFAADMQEGGER